MKKFSCLVLALIMMVCFVGCGSKEMSKEDEIVTLKWIVPGDKQTDVKSVVDEINKIIEPTIGANLDLQFVDTSAFTERMTMNMASGADFDLCFTGYVNPYIQSANKGGFLELTDIIDKHAPELKNAIPEYAWDIAKINGEIYAVPNLQIYATATSLVVYDDIASKYDFDFSKVKTIDDIEPYLEMVKNGEKGIYPYRTNYGITPWFTAKYEKLTSDVVVNKKDANDVKLLRDTEEFKNGVTKLNEWYKKGYIRSDVLSVGDDSADYRNGKYAVTNAVWKPGAEATEEANSGRKCKFILLEEPYMSKSKGTAAMTAIGANCKNPEKAIKLISLVNTNKDLFNLISYGIEGKHYEMKDNRVNFIDNSGFSHKNPWVFGCQFNAFLVKGQDDNVWEETKRVNEESEKSPILGFVADETRIKSEISQCSTVMSEYSVLNTGASNPSDYLDVYNKKLDVAGQGKILDEYKKQIKDYLK